MLRLKPKKAISLFLSVSLVFQSLPLNTIFASTKWVATPFHNEAGEYMSGLEAATRGKNDWLTTTESMPAKVQVNGDTLTMSNGSISRQFHIPEVGGTEFYTTSYENTYVEKELLTGEISPDTYIGLYSKPYSEIFDEEDILLDPEYFFIGGDAEENAKWIKEIEVEEPLAAPVVLNSSSSGINVVQDTFNTSAAGLQFEIPDTEPIEMTNTFIFDGYEVFDECEKPFEWTPRSKRYSDPAASDWPPKGKRVEFTFSAPDTFPEEYEGIKVKLIYEMYDNLAGMKKRVELVQENDNTITLGRLAPEVFKGNSNMDDLLYIETNYTGGDEATIPFDNGLDCACEDEPNDSPFRELEGEHHTCYDIGPAYELPDNLGGNEFKSYDTYELIFSTYWFEQQSRERLGMYRKLFPWITDNPLTFHNKYSLTKETIDMVAEAGFEMIIQSYGSPSVSDTDDMLARDEATLDKYKELVDYAHSKDIEIGMYQAQYQLSQFKREDAYGYNDIAQWGTWCFASAAFDDYWDSFKYFIDYTGVDCVEIDGSYPNCLCDNGELHVNEDRETDPADPNSTTTGNPSKYAVHNGYHDSKVKQWENVLRTMNTEFRNRDIYIKVPAWYYMSGGNKCGIGYEEVAWAQPRDEQLLYTRQLIHNASYVRTMSMSWSHIPFASYQGGGSDAVFTPFKDHKEAYNWVLAQNIGNGITSDFRGAALYDDETKDILDKWINMFNKYRGIISADLVRMTQASYGEDIESADRTRGLKMDTLFHADANNEGEKGLLWVYNQTDQERTEIITVPMYYTGLTDLEYPPAPIPGSTGKNVHEYWIYPPNFDWLPEYRDNYTFPTPTGDVTGNAVFAAEGVTMTPMSIDSNGNVMLEVTLPPMSFTYYTIYDEDKAPEVSIDIEKVNGLFTSDITEKSIGLKWNDDIDIKVTENGINIEDHGLSVDFYQIYRNDEKLAVSYDGSFVDTDLNPDTEYEYKVSAVVSGIEGPISDSVSGKTLVDDIAPSVISAVPVSNSQIIITFDERIDKTSATDKSNYSVSDDVNVIIAKMTGQNEITLTVRSLLPEKQYDLTVSNIGDLWGNTSELESLQLNYGNLREFDCDLVENGELIDTARGQNAKTNNIKVEKGLFNNAISFTPNKKSYVDLGSNIINGMETYSISLWIKPENTENEQVILSQGQEMVEVDDFTLSIEDGKLKFRTSNKDNSEELILEANKELPKNLWTQVTLVRNRNTFELYQNDTLVAKGSSDIGPVTNFNFLVLGAQKNHAGGERANFYEGLMDNIVISSFNMSENDILEKYYGNPSIFQPLLDRAKAIEVELYEPKSYKQVLKGINTLEGFINSGTLFQGDLIQNELYMTVTKLQSDIENLVFKTKGIDSMYTMNEKSGDIVNDVINGKTAGLVNGDKTRVGTPFDRGILISDYIGNYIQADNKGLAGRDNYTIQGFIKPWAKDTTGMGDDFINEYSEAGNQVILEDDEGGLSLSLENGYLTLTLGGDVPLTITSDTEIKHDTINGENRQAWNNFAITRDGNEFKLYLNGDLVGSDSKSNVGDLGSTMYIGADKHGKNNFNGIIDEFAFYTSAITPRDIEKNANEIPFVKEDRVNLAKDKTVTSSQKPDDIENLTDGLLFDMAGTDTPFTARVSGNELNLKFDLGEVYDIDAISFTMFSRAYGTDDKEANKFRAYRDIVIEVSNDEEFKTGVKTVYNSDKDNTLELGSGNDEMHYSTDLGYDIVLDTPVTGRYVRITSGAFDNFIGDKESSVNINELEVFGYKSGDLYNQLVSLVAEASSIDKKMYSLESGEILQKALNKANILLDNLQGSDSSQYESKILSMINELEKAIDNLVLVEAYGIIDSKYSMNEKYGTKVKDINGKSAELINGDKTRVGTPFDRGIFISDFIGNYIVADNSGLAGRESYTLQGFIKPWAKNTTGMGDDFIDEYNETGEQVILEDDNSGLSLSLENGYLILNLGGDTPLTITSDTEIKHDTINNENRQAWNNFAITRSGDEFKLYLNGDLVGNGTQSGVGDLGSTMYIGADNAGENNFNGIIDEFTFYTSALDESDIVENANDIPFVKADRVNLAKDKTVTSDFNPDDIENITDGLLFDMASTNTPFTARVNSNKLNLKIDLGEEYSIDTLSFTMFSRAYGTENDEDNIFRAHRDIVIEVADDEDFTTGIKTVYNSDTDNTLGLGVGNDVAHYSTDLGNDIVLDAPVTGRYVRISSGGYDSLTGSYGAYVGINELEVFGSSTGELQGNLVQLVKETENIDRDIYSKESLADLDEAIHRTNSLLGTSGTEELIRVVRSGTVDIKDLNQCVVDIDTALDNLELKYIRTPKVIKHYPFGMDVPVYSDTFSLIFDEKVSPVVDKELTLTVDGQIYSTKVTDMTINNIGETSIASIPINKLMHGETPLSLDHSKNYSIDLDGGAFVNDTDTENLIYNRVHFRTSKENDESYDITIVADNGGTIVMGESGTYNAFDNIKLEAISNSEEYEFTNWSVSGEGVVEDESSIKTSFLVLNGKAEVAANFKYLGPIIRPVTGIELDIEDEALFVNETIQLNANITPDNATNKDVTWTSSNTDVAIVDISGAVTAIGDGTAIITVTTDDGGFMDTCTVSVTTPKVNITGVSLNKDLLQLTAGDNSELVPKITPTNASNKNVTWTSDNENVAIVDELGVVTAIDKGVATITVTTNDGGFTDTCIVIVTALEIEVDGVNLNRDELQLVTGETNSLKATVTPANATNKDVTWTSDNEDVATVDETGKITAIGQGTATITVTTDDGNYNATCEITVKAEDVTEPEDNGGNSGNGGGGGSRPRPTNPPEETEVTEPETDNEENEFEVNGKVNEDGTFLVTIEDDGMPLGISNDDLKIIINVSDLPEDTNSISIDLPAEKIKEVNENENTELVIDCGNFSTVTFSNDAVASLVDTNDETINVSMKKVDDTVQFELKRGDELVTDITNGIKIAIPNLGMGNVLVTVDENGNESIIKKSIVEDGDAYALVDGSCEIKVINNTKAFNDVNEEDWYNDDVAFVSSRELFVGIDENNFGTDQNMTRGMLATVLQRLDDGVNTSTETNFADVDAGKWYYDGVNWAADAGIISGSGDGNFSPNADITREQLAVMMYNYANYSDMDTSVSREILDFNDTKDISSWANDAMSWAVENGLFYGDGTNVNPQNKASRVEVSAVINRFVNLMVK